jgi:hypothetical protein
VEIPEVYRSAFALDLIPVGTRWSALCPFHTETKPSFVVYEDGGYYCHGCHVHGTFEDVLYRINKHNTFLPGLDSQNEDTRVSRLCKKLEKNLMQVLKDRDFKSRCDAYDKFDNLLLKVKIKMESLDYESLALVYSLNCGYQKIIEEIQNSS